MRLEPERNLGCKVWTRPGEHSRPVRLRIGVHTFSMAIPEARDLARRLADMAGEATRNQHSEEFSQ